MASKKPRRVKPGLSEVWELRASTQSWKPPATIVAVLSVSQSDDKGCREVECLILDSGTQRVGAIVKLTNGAFAAPNVRIA